MLKTNRGRRLSAAIWVVLGLALAGAAQPYWEEQDKLLAFDGAADDLFGFSVSISGDYAIVGVRDDDDKGENSGSAYIFKREGTAWIQQQKLLASDGAADDLFGCSVSISGDYAIVGACQAASFVHRCGAAYIFKREGTWIQQRKLQPGTGPGSAFGFSVSISGDYAIVGVPYYVDSSGVAYVFEREDTDWINQGQLQPDDLAAGDKFGFSVSIGGDYAIVGAPDDDDNGDGSGSAYLYRFHSSWIEKPHKLLASDGAAGEAFGWSVSIGGDRAVVGAYGDDDNGDASGSAYIFRGDGTAWTQQQKLLASDGAAGDYFGHSVSISGDYASVGAVRDDELSGSAYIFKEGGQTTWTQQQKLLASDGAGGEAFGWSVSICGDYAIVGAVFDRDYGANSGSAYIFASATSPIYRFWSPVNLRHFYTIKESEKNKLIANYSHVWTYEGLVYDALPEQSDPSLVPVYRFWSGPLMAHFYTVKESEKDKLINNYADVWTYEGPVFYAYPQGAEPLDAAAVYRFWSDSLGCHFYTISETERDKLFDYYSDVWTYEDVAWYAYP